MHHETARPDSVQRVAALLDAMQHDKPIVMLPESGKTSAEAARSLGAGWVTVLLRVVLPNVRSAVLSAALLTVALVLGEFTLASLLNFPTLQVAINLIGKRDAALSIAVSLAALLFAFALLLSLSAVAGRRRAVRLTEPLAPAQETA